MLGLVRGHAIFHSFQNLEAREKSTPSDQIEHPLLIFPGKIRYVNKSGDCGSIFEILL